jgi:hypothetical protein
MAKFCGAQRRGNYAMCERPGQDRYDGRCHIHRKPTPEELKAKKIARQAEFAAMEYQLDLNEARSGFLKLALARGLAAPETIQEFERFKKLSEKG